MSARGIVTILSFILLAAAGTMPAGAADESGVGAEDSAPAAAEARVDAGLEHRLELSRELHKYTSTADRVNAAIDSVSLQLPESRREAFKTAMRNVLNYRVIEKISIDTMAEIFTAEELEYLIDYNKNPLSRSVDEKFVTYEKTVGPEISRILDKAMMRVRTGASPSP